MNWCRILTAVAAIALAAGVVLVLVPDGDTSWFTYAPESDAGEAVGISFSDARLVTERDMFGYALVAVAALIGAGMVGYRVGARRVDEDSTP